MASETVAVTAPEVVFVLSDNPDLYIFWCEGCGYCHHIDAKVWTFDRNLTHPTVSPSLLVNKSQSGGDPRCHIFIKAGKIQYLGDCTHALAGQTVTMVPPPDGEAA